MALFGHAFDPRFAPPVPRKTEPGAYVLPPGYSPTMMSSVPIGPARDNLLGAAGDMGRNYQNMRDANFIEGDKYFHCKGNCEATRRGPLGRWTAEKMSNLREVYQQRVEGESRADAAADQQANHLGRNGAQSHPEKPCREICRPLRPNKLPERY